MNRYALFALIVTGLPLIAHAEPRADVESVAALIESRYFDPGRGEEIATGLRKSAAAGDFDRFKDPRDLAVELSRRLKPLDGHFDVRWNSPETPRTLTSRPGSSLPEGRTNYGFSRVERLHGNIAYMELTYAAHIDFADADSPSKRTADSALAMSRDADAVIIDLRRNGGGSPAMVGYLVSAFVDEKADVYNTFHSRQGTTSERPARAYAKPMLSVPLYVLTSGRTGSAAEAIAFTLQSAQRAVIVGARSGGAANPGAPFTTPQGYTLFISTGSPRNPVNGRNWEGDGVKPDVEVAAESALVRAHELALQKVLGGSIAGAARTDAQWALDALSAKAQSKPLKSTGEVGGQFGPYKLETVAGVLKANRARWPTITLSPLERDLYYFDHDPSRRVRVERENNAVVAITIHSSDGSELRLPRSAAE
jgi:hypothetical protein